MGMVKRFEVHLVTLDPTVGSEMQKTRPCLIISPDKLNGILETVIIAPLTSKGKAYRFRVPCHFEGKHGHIALDQMRSVDKTRLIKLLGQMDSKTQELTLEVLARMFAK
jgi:mRNA interferase MazF